MVSRKVGHLDRDVINKTKSLTEKVKNDPNLVIRLFFILSLIEMDVNSPRSLVLLKLKSKHSYFSATKFSWVEEEVFRVAGLDSNICRITLLLSQNFSERLLFYPVGRIALQLISRKHLS